MTYYIHTKNGIFHSTNTSKLDFSKYRGKTLLDLGSGFGDFVDFCISQGIDARGIEIDPFFYDHSKQKDRIILGDMFEQEWNADILFYYLAGSNREDELIERLNQTTTLVILNTQGIPQEYIVKFTEKLKIKYETLA